MRDTDYILTFGWMTNHLGLKGSERDVYAIIYSFSKDGESEFSGSSSYLADLAGISKRRVLDILSSLVESGLLHKNEANRNGIKYCAYAAALDRIPSSVVNFTGGEKSSPVVVKNLHGGGEEISPNNTIDNTSIYIEKENRAKENSPKKFVKPTLEEVRARINEMGYHVDAEAFIAYYESNGWRVGANPMKDWRAALVTWEKKETNKKESYGANSKYTSNTAPRKRVNTDWSKEHSTI